jgi:glycerol kinase
MIKATYGTGSSIMMNVGESPVFSQSGVVTSLAWKIGGKVNYVLEGNINYTGAVITWLKDDLKIIACPGETEELAKTAIPGDTTYLVPAFSGLGAP